MTEERSDPASDGERVARDVLAWRSGRLQRLTAPDSWLSLIGKHWLEPGLHTVGSAPECQVVLPGEHAPAHMGTLHVTADEVRFEPATDIALTLLQGGV